MVENQFVCGGKEIDQQIHHKFVATNVANKALDFGIKETWAATLTNHVIMDKSFSFLMLNRDHRLTSNELNSSELDLLNISCA